MLLTPEAAGAAVVGAAVVGTAVVGAAVVGTAVVGAAVVGAAVVGATVVGAAEVGATVVGAAAGAPPGPLPLAASSNDIEPSESSSTNRSTPPMRNSAGLITPLPSVSMLSYMARSMV